MQNYRPQEVFQALVKNNTIAGGGYMKK